MGVLAVGLLGDGGHGRSKCIDVPCCFLEGLEEHHDRQRDSQDVGGHQGDGQWPLVLAGHDLDAVGLQLVDLHDDGGASPGIPGGRTPQE